MFRLVLVLIFVVINSTLSFAEPVEIKVGLSLPLSGRLAYVGEDIRQGVELAVEEFSTKTLKFSTIYEDNQHQSKLAAGTGHKLLNIDKADIIISLWDMADVIAPLAERSKTPHLAIRWNPHIAEKYSYTLTVESTYKSYSDKLIELFKALKIETLGVLTEEGKGWILGSDYLQKVAPKRGIRIVGDERFTNETSDHRSLVLRLMKKKPEMILLLSNPPHTEILVQRIKEANPKQLFTGYFEYTESPELVEGVPFGSQFQAASWFEEKFLKKYGKPFKARAPQAYDIIKLVSTVYQSKAAKLSGTQLITEISHLQGIPGASGILNVTPTRNIESDCVWKIFDKGKLRIFTEDEAKQFALK